jgi:hypothetical protein
MQNRCNGPERKIKYALSVRPTQSNNYRVLAVSSAPNLGGRPCSDPASHSSMLPFLKAPIAANFKGLVSPGVSAIEQLLKRALASTCDFAHCKYADVILELIAGQVTGPTLHNKVVVANFRRPGGSDRGSSGRER